MNHKYNLLDEKIFSTTQGSKSLPGVLEALCAGASLQFTRLPGHLEMSFYRFLVQLAALCVRKRFDERDWKIALLALTDDRVEPWCLYVQDSLIPAFMQPPGFFHDTRGWEHEFPDAIQTLGYGKMHHVKGDKVAWDRPEDWVYSLIFLQTDSVFVAHGKPGCARASQTGAHNGVVSFVPSLDWSDRFLSDLEKIPLSIRRYDERRGVMAKLLWTLRWQGEAREMIPAESLHPLCIEVCRRIRLDENLKATLYRTDNNRTDYKTGHIVYDPWTPLAGANTRNGHKTVKVTMTASGASPKFVARTLMADAFTRADCHKPTGKDRLFMAEAIVKKSGGRPNQTAGIRRRVLPAKVKDRLDVLAVRDARVDRLFELIRPFRPVMAHLGFNYKAFKIDLEAWTSEVFFQRLDNQKVWMEMYYEGFFQRCYQLFNSWLKKTDGAYIRRPYKRKKISLYGLLEDLRNKILTVGSQEEIRRARQARLTGLHPRVRELHDRLKSCGEQALAMIRGERPGMTALALARDTIEGLSEKQAERMKWVVWHLAGNPHARVRPVYHASFLKTHVNKYHWQERLDNPDYLETMFRRTEDRGVLIDPCQLTDLFLLEGEAFIDFAHIVHRGALLRRCRVSLDRGVRGRGRG